MKLEELAHDTRIGVKVIRRSGSAVLVEWKESEITRRATVPLFELEFDDEFQKSGKINPEILEIGIPYGVPWEELIGEIKVTPLKIAESLRQRGIWTLEDAQAHPNSVVGALQAAYALDMATLIRKARRMKEESHD